MLTRKHFKQIAEIIKHANEHPITDSMRESAEVTRSVVVGYLYLELRDLCQSENPNFDIDKFYKACYSTN